MKTKSYSFFGILLGLFFIQTTCLVANEISLPNAVEQYPTEPFKPVKFDKKRYNELVKKILRTKSPSFLSSAANKTFKEIFYLGASGLVGAVALKKAEISGNSHLKYSQFLFGAVLTHTVLQVLFDYLLVSKDQNLQNLEDFEKYIKESLSSEEELIKNNSDLVLRLFEKDYGLILNKLNHEGETGFIRKIIKFLFKESIFLLEASAFGAAAGAHFLGSDENMLNAIGAGSAAGIGYFIFLALLFDGLLAGKDQHLLKIEKLREIDQFFEEIKIEKLALQHEHIASVS